MIAIDDTSIAELMLPSPLLGVGRVLLMFKIANQSPANILRLRPGLRLCVLRAIYKAMMQNAEKRYWDGEEMTRALRESAMRISGLAA